MDSPNWYDSPKKNMGITMLEFKLLLLLLVANGAPVLAWDLWKDTWAHPVDGGIRLVDGRRLLGNAKTWRGIVASLLATTLAAKILGLTPETGLQMAAMAMAGDLFSSFLKRRLGIEDSGQAPGLDQIPESLLPLLVIRSPMGLSWPNILLLVALFFLLEVSLSPLLYRLGIRKRPY